MNIEQRKQLAVMAIKSCSNDGRKFKEGAVEAAVCSSIWAISRDQMARLMSEAMDKYEIPQGIILPWGKVIKPSQTR